MAGQPLFRDCQRYVLTAIDATKILQVLYKHGVSKHAAEVSVYEDVLGTGAVVIEQMRSLARKLMKDGGGAGKALAWQL